LTELETFSYSVIKTPIMWWKHARVWMPSWSDTKPIT
jgi:hypothetical protein